MCYGVGWLRAEAVFHKNSIQAMWQNVLWTEEAKVELSGHNSKIYFWCKTKTTCKFCKEHHTCGEARWWQHHPTGLSKTAEDK